MSVYGFLLQRYKTPKIFSRKFPRFSMKNSCDFQFTLIPTAKIPDTKIFFLDLYPDTKICFGEIRADALLQQAGLGKCECTAVFHWRCSGGKPVAHTYRRKVRSCLAFCVQRHERTCGGGKETGVGINGLWWGGDACQQDGI